MIKLLFLVAVVGLAAWWIALAVGIERLRLGTISALQVAACWLLNTASRLYYPDEREAFHDGLERELWNRIHPRDRCEECRGERGGVYGNENVVDGRTLCDYCTMDVRARGGRPRADS